VEFRLESVGDDLGAGEGVAGGAVLVPLVCPICLTNHKAEFLDPRLAFPLLNIRPSYPFLSLLCRSVVLIPELKPVLNGIVFSELVPQLLSGPIQAG